MNRIEAKAIANMGRMELTLIVFIDVFGCWFWIDCVLSEDSRAKTGSPRRFTCRAPAEQDFGDSFHNDTRFPSQSTDESIRLTDPGWPMARRDAIQPLRTLVLLRWILRSSRLGNAASAADPDKAPSDFRPAGSWPLFGSAAGYGRRRLMLMRESPSRTPAQLMKRAQGPCI